MKNVMISVVLLALAGCSSLTGTPTASTGWLIQVGTPSLVHVPVIADQASAQTQTTHFGTMRTTGGIPAPSAPGVPVVPVPRPGPVQGAGNNGPCGAE